MPLEATAPAAPSAPATTAPGGSAPSGNPSVVPAAKSAPAGAQAPKTGPAAGRSTTGQFLPKQGEDVAQGGKPPAPPEPPKPHYRTKLKVDGREEDVEYANESDLQRDLQLARAAQARMKKAAQVERQMKDLDERLKASPEEVLAERGIDIDDLAVKRMVDRAKRALMSPEEIEADRLRTEHSQATKELETFRQKEHQRVQQQYSTALWSEMKPQFEAALDEIELPKDMGMLEAIAEVGNEFIAAGIDLSPKEIVREVARRQDAYMWSRVVKMPASVLLKRLGPDLTRAIVDLYTDDWQAKRRAQAPTTSTPAPSPEPARAGPTKYVDINEYKKNLGLR